MQKLIITYSPPSGSFREQGWTVFEKGFLCCPLARNADEEFYGELANDLVFQQVLSKALRDCRTLSVMERGVVKEKLEKMITVTQDYRGTCYNLSAVISSTIPSVDEVFIYQGGGEATASRRLIEYFLQGCTTVKILACTCKREEKEKLAVELGVEILWTKCGAHEEVLGLLGI